MIHRQIVEFNYESQSVDKLIGEFYDLLKRAFLSQGYSIVAIKTGKTNEELEKYLPVLATQTPQPEAPQAPDKTPQQQVKEMQKQVAK